MTAETRTNFPGSKRTCGKVTKHTPGPWRWDTTSPGQQHGGSDGLRVYGTGHPSEWVADCGVGDSDLARVANAKLIAAAPDLLEALQALLAWNIEREEGSEYKARVQKPVVIEKCRQAIDKATS